MVRARIRFRVTISITITIRFRVKIRARSRALGSLSSLLSPVSCLLSPPSSLLSPLSSILSPLSILLSPLSKRKNLTKHPGFFIFSCAPSQFLLQKFRGTNAPTIVLASLRTLGMTPDHRACSPSLTRLRVPLGHSKVVKVSTFLFYLMFLV